ncbi:helix-turn-helix transcriptional regulator [Billgrantia diversa]|uniref:helix-turn-helix domain-containing protein n=1 Tax=Halomonas sp. MCCC 1A13316 TaxID=2733487 RepID=UPI0018A589C6|nr:helix-turn-helix transcriptional regulator [Halomonas sp. MCCC 1A13316]QOR37698.1 helix-turn-helix transcriptional regulator [Halomonas sp. MCCC 1A13316]
MTTNSTTLGQLLKMWRQRRRLSQLALATEADVSQRHLSFVESGRVLPSREMLLRLTEQLNVPLRERNRLLLAAGFAPAYGERPIDAPEFETIRGVIERLLASHVPYPALAVDRHWHLLMGNRPLELLLGGIEPALLEPPVNVLRLTLHPQGLASRIRNFGEWRGHILERLARQADTTADPALASLSEELKGYPVPTGARPHLASRTSHAGIVVPLELAMPDGRVLSLLSTTTVFGTPLDITLEELAIESFFPADEDTQAALQQLAAAAPPG